MEKGRLPAAGTHMVKRNFYEYNKGMFRKEYFWRTLMTVCGLFVIVLTISIGAFLVYQGPEPLQSSGTA